MDEIKTIKTYQHYAFKRQFKKTNNLRNTLKNTTGLGAKGNQTRQLLLAE